MSLLLGRGQERAFARLYRRHAADVYRYALLVLRDPLDAENVTRVTFANARRAYGEGARPENAHNWLLGIVHDICRLRALQADAPLAEELWDEAWWSPCQEAELALSRELDGELDRPARKVLQSHLRACDDCRRLAERQKDQRAALQGFQRVALPDGLAVARRRIAAPLARLAAVVAISAVGGALAAGGADPREWGRDATRIQPADAATRKHEPQAPAVKLAKKRRSVPASGG